MGYDKRSAAKEYTPVEGDTLQSIAKRETEAGNPVTWQDIARFNWGTDKADVVDEFLRDELCCYKRGDDKRFVVSADIQARTPLLIPQAFVKSGLATAKTHTITVTKQDEPPKQFEACTRLEGVTFEFDSDKIRASETADLEKVAKKINDTPNAKAMIFGHTDKVGTDKYNKNLSEKRAKSVFNFLTTKLGVGADRFMPPQHMGCGEFNPERETEAAHEPNRRVTVFLFNPDRLPNIPCKHGDLAPCKKQVAAPLPRNRDSFHCSFYDSIAKNCPAEGGVVPPVDVEFELVEIVEVVQLDKEKWVKGAGMDSTDTIVLTENVERTDKEGADFKQFINLDRDLEGKDKRHPEFGREIRFKARVVQKDGKTDALAGAKVKFTFKRTDGPDRKNLGAPEPDVWIGADLTGEQKEGFGSTNGKPEIEGTTNDRGWTNAVSFFVSSYAGDKFKIFAELAAGTKGAGPAPKSTLAEYVVAKRFWYQLTHAKGFAVPQPTAGEAAYKELSIEMVKANVKEFEKSELPADLQDRTFMPEFMLSAGGATTNVAVIGGHNKDEFAKMKTDETDKPLKAHLIVCEHQCDPSKNRTPTGVFKLTANSQAVTLSQGAAGPIICKPALRAGTKLVAVGEWSPSNTPFTKGGNITDADISIESTRSNTLTVKVTLPAGTPVPTAAKPVFVKLQMETAASFLGESFGNGNILCVFRPKAAVGTPGSEVDFNDTAAHEIGHMWNQTPQPGRQPKSLKDHPNQHVGHGGSGSHCRHGATVAAGPVNFQDPKEDKPRPENGDCLMFRSFSPKCLHKFCPTCKPYVRLQNMAAL